MKSTRRTFLGRTLGGAAAVSIGSRLPLWWRSAAAFGTNTPRGDRILVVLQLSGGNDGLNTVVPYADDAYRAARPTLAVPENRVRKIDDRLGWHPSAAGLAELTEQGQVAILQGIGYERPNRSHFESMDIWHSCRRKNEGRTTGWLGRAFDAAPRVPGADALGVHLGHGKLPFALVSRDVSVPSIDSPERFRLQEGPDGKVRDALMDLSTSTADDGDALLGFLQQSTASALSASERIAEALAPGESGATYPDHDLGRKFRTVGRLIAAELSTRVYYLELDGFDTHAKQAPAHESLLERWSESVVALLDDLRRIGRADDVTIMCFSEFGRRVAENASEGTDHGAAAPMFLVGPSVRGGVIGDLPSLQDLDDGDLKFHTDFRRVYASVLEQWLGWPSDEVLGGDLAPLDCFV